MSKKFNYVYQITEKSTNKKYIGVRSCDIDPTEDLGVLYFSSSSDKQFMENQMLNPSDFVYSILSTHESRIDAVQMEINLHDQFDVSNNPDFFNISKQTSTGWDSSGFISVKDDCNKVLFVSVNDPRYLSGDLISLNSDRIKAKDFYGNVTMTTRSDPKYLSGELVSIYTKQIYSIDVDGFVKKVDITDDRLKSGVIKPISNQLVMCVDDNNNLIRMYKTDRDYINKKYKEVRRFVKVSKGKYAFADDIRFK